jgi:branched-chain amino acid transport system permease protein
MILDLVNLSLQGVMLGGLYALFAVGLSLSVGVMRFINIAHGDLIVLVSFLLMSIAGWFGVSPFVAALVVLPISFAGGYVLQRFLLQRIVGQGILPVILVTFGLAIIIQNSLLQIYGPDTRKLFGGSLEVAAVSLGDQINIGVFPFIVCLAAVVVIAGLDAFLYRSSIGARIRAVADDPAAAELIGLSAAPVYAIAMGIVGLTVTVAACAMSISSNFDPSIGPSRLLTAFEAVVLGGLGSLWGTLIGGILLGVAQNVGSHFDAAWQTLAQHLTFLIFLALRPRGLFTKG